MVAIHGLGGHHHSTWMATDDKEEDKLWLRDFLPKDLPKACIITFAYISDIGFMSCGGINLFECFLFGKAR